MSRLIEVNTIVLTKASGKTCLSETHEVDRSAVSGLASFGCRLVGDVYVDAARSMHKDATLSKNSNTACRAMTCQVKDIQIIIQEVGYDS